MDSRYRRAINNTNKTGGAVIKTQAFASETKANNLVSKYNKYVVEDNRWSSDEYSDEGDYYDDFVATRYKRRKKLGNKKPKAQMLDFFPNGILPSSITDQISNMLTNMEASLTTTTRFVDTARKIMSICLKLATCHCSKWCFKILSFQLTDYLITFGIPTVDVKDIIELISDVFKPKAQMLTEFVFNNVATIGTIGFILLTTIFSNSLPSYANLKTVAADASVFGRACAGGIAIHKVVSLGMEFALDKYFLYVHGVPRNVKDADELIMGCSEFYLEVQSLVALDNISKCVELEYARRVESAHRTGLQLVSKTQNSIYGKDIFLAVKTHFDTISRLYNRVMSSGVLGDGSRLEPVVFYIHGNPGVGKSTTTYVLAKELLNAEEPMLAENLDKNMYNRRVEQEFWDGYTNQPVCIFDDFGQMTDTESKPNKEYYEIIRTSNISAYPLHMASINDKNSTFFTSKAVVINCNSAHYNIPSLTCPDAFERRVYPKIEQLVKPEFGYRVTSRNGKDYYRLDKNYIRQYNKDRGIDSGYTMDSALFKVQDIKEPMDWIEFRKWACNKYIQTRDDSLEFKTFLKNYKPQAQMHLRDTISVGSEILFLYNMGVDIETITGIAEIKDILSDSMTYSEKVDFINILYPELTITGILGKLVAESCSSVLFYLKRVTDITLEKVTIFKERISNFDFTHYLTVFNILVVALLLILTWFGTHINRRQGAITNERGNTRIGAESRVLNDNNKQRVVTESRILADNMKQRISTESRIIDDKSKCRVVTEGDVKALSINIPVENPEAQALSDINAYEIISNKILRNTFSITFCDGDVPRATFIGTIIVGRVMLVPSHCKLLLATCSNLKIVSSFSKNGSHEFVVPLSSIKLFDMKNGLDEFKDTTLMEFDRNFPQFPDLRKYFVNNNDLSKFDSVRVTMISLRSIGDDVIPILSKSTASSRHHVGKLAYDLESRNSVQELRIRDYYSYSMETKSGDCGGLIIALSPQLGRKIIGMHVAGNPGIGYATSVSIENIEKALSQVPKVSQLVIYDYDNEAKFVPKGNFYELGALKNAPSSTITKLRPSPLYGKISTPITCPATLEPIMVEGVKVDPLLKGLEKAGGNTPILDNGILKEAANHYQQSVVNGIMNNTLLTYEEAVTGIPSEEFVDCINRKSSPGYPWMLGNSGGKYKWFGNRDVIDTSNNEIRKVVLERIEQAKLGIRVPTIWVDTLKDERRPLEKVALGKTRVFSNGPMDFTIAVRMYFGRFCQHYMVNRVDNDSAVGINPFSYDWTRVLKKITRVGSKVIAGDFANYDGCMWAEIMYECLDIIQKFYDDGAENQLVREVLFSELVNSWHLYKGNVYMWTHSNPSGNPLTVILNSMYGAIVVRYVYITITGLNIETFNKNVSMIDYGDDNIINVSDNIVSIFNQDSITLGFKNIGMTYTDEEKSGSWEPYRDVHNIKFLKRSFRFDPLINGWVAPLQLDVILEMINWVRGDLDHHELCKENVETAFRELSLHDPDTFKDQTTKIYKEARLLDLVPALYTREHYLTNPITKW